MNNSRLPKSPAINGLDLMLRFTLCMKSNAVRDSQLILTEDI